MDLAATDILLLLPAAIIAGAVNSIAGGGTFLSFPILILLGLPPLVANTTNKVGIALASFSGVIGFARELRSVRHHLAFYIALATLGSILGSYLLLTVFAESFAYLVPWLMLAATLLFAFGGHAIRRLRPQQAHHQPPGCARRAGLGLGQFLIGLYGGFFAAGMGIVMLALYELAGMRHIHEMNALKVAVALAINLVSAGVFIASGMVDWSVATVLFIGALIGGYYGAVLSRLVPQPLLRGLIVAYGAGMTLYLFLR